MTAATNRQFEMQIDIGASREAVWAAISDAREVARWFPPIAEVEPGVGGRVLWKWGEKHAWVSTIDTWEPGKCLRLRYDSAVSDGKGGRQPLFVEFRLEGKGGTTTLRLVHSGFGPESDFDAEYDGISQGWPAELRSLRLYLENHWGKDRRLAWTARSTQEDAQAVWQRLIGAKGINAPGVTDIPEGQPFEIVLPGAPPIKGTALYSPAPREFSGMATNLGNAWIRLHCERWAGATQVWLWLALYEQTDKAAAYQASFDALLDRLVS